MRKMLRNTIIIVILMLMVMLPNTACAAGTYIKNYRPYNGESIDGNTFTVVFDSEDHGIRYQCISQSIYSSSNQSKYSKTTCVITDQNGRVLEPEEYCIHTDDFVSVYLLQPKAGTYTIDVESTWYFYSSDKTRKSTFTLVIQQADLASLIAVTPYSNVYDGTTHAAINVTNLTSLAEDQFSVEFSSDNGGTYSEEIPHISDAGSYPVTVRLTGSHENFTTHEHVQVITAEIAAREVTIIPDSVSKIYGEADPAFTFQATGELADEPLTGVVLEREPGEELGSYAITATVIDGLNPNYDISTKTGEMSIASIPMTVAANNIETCFDEGCEYRITLKAVDHKGNDITDSVRVLFNVDNGEYSSDIPVFTEPGNHTVSYIVEKDRHETVTGEVCIRITPHNIIVEPAIAATCTTDGKTEGQYCAVCKTEFIVAEIITATGHQNTTEYQEAAATCTAEGLSAGVYCEDCDTWLVERTVLAMTAHVPEDDRDVPPTCTESGWTRGSHCQECNLVIVEPLEIPATGHSRVVEPAVAATCTTAGYTQHEYCEWCDEIFVDKQEIPAMGHSVRVLDAVTPTCTSGGLTEGSVCNICGVVLVPQESITALPHVKKVLAGVEATCTKPGLTLGSECSVCGVIIEAQTEIPMLPHTEVIVVGTEATCTHTGMTEGVECSTCGAVLIEQTEIPMESHSATIIPAVVPTCTEVGYTAGVRCSVCRAVIDAPSEIPASHSKVVDVPAVQPSCTQDGRTEQSHCEECGVILSATVVLPATGHSVSIDPFVGPTITSTGLTEGAHCDVCKIILVEQQIIPMLQIATSNGEKLSYSETAGSLFASVELSDSVIVLGEKIDLTFSVRTSNGPIRWAGEWTELNDNKYCVNQQQGKEVWEKNSLKITWSYTPTVTGYVNFTLAVGDAEDNTVTIATQTVRVQAVGEKEAYIGAGVDKYLTVGVELNVTECFIDDQIVAKCRIYSEANSVKYVYHWFMYDEEGNLLKEITGRNEYVNEKEVANISCSLTPKDAGNVVFFIEVTDSLNDSASVRTDRVFVKGDAVHRHQIVAVEKVMPTCTDTGLTEGAKCSVCGEILVKQTVIPKREHSIEHVSAVEPTCGSDGLTEGQRCTVCNVVLVEQERISQTNNHEWNDGVVAVEPTLENDGALLLTCIVCGFSKLEPIPATGNPEPSRLPGDANEDGNVDIFDALLLLQYDVGWDVEINLTNADVNADGNANIFDALLILQYDVGWDVELL